jgi:hypothetical protein
LANLSNLASNTSHALVATGAAIASPACGTDCASCAFVALETPETKVAFHASATSRSLLALGTGQTSIALFALFAIDAFHTTRALRTRRTGSAALGFVSLGTSQTRWTPQCRWSSVQTGSTLLAAISLLA